VAFFSRFQLNLVLIVLLRLKECGSIGIIPNEESAESGDLTFQLFLDNLIFELCFYQSPDDLQCIMFCEHTDDWRIQEEAISKYKHLPHFRELLVDDSPMESLSSFAFNKAHAGLVLNKLLEILTERRSLGDDEKYPHIVVFFLDDDDFLKRHPVSQYLPDVPSESDKKNYGLTFVFCKRYEEKLPKYCGQVISMDVKSNIWQVSPYDRLFNQSESAEDRKRKYSFFCDPLPEEPGHLFHSDAANERYRAFKMLSALHYYRIAKGEGVPEYVPLFELRKNNESVKETYLSKFNSGVFWGDTQLDTEEIQDIPVEQSSEKAVVESQETQGEPLMLTTIVTEDANLVTSEAVSYWTTNVTNITKSLAVPVGKKSSGEIVELDLHEKKDGPHMLVAGTTGSGKSETILTFLIGLCIYYSPEQVNLLLVDMKGGGFVKRLDGLPHIVGTVTDIDGDEDGVGNAYVLKRFLLSMTSEAKRRKKLFDDMGVDSLDKYIEARSSSKNLQRQIDNVARNESKPKDKKRRIERIRELGSNPNYSLAHLFIVIDEFKELMQFSNENSDIDFKTGIDQLFRIGRSLGFHLILSSQNIEGAISGEVRVNAKARLCLKVATREASREMIGNDNAYSYLMPAGRAHLLVGANERYEYFQSGFSDASIESSADRPIVVIQAEKSGRYSPFYNSHEDNKSDKVQAETEKAKKADSQLKAMVEKIRIHVKNAKIKTPYQVFMPTLPAHCYYDFEDDYDNGKFVVIEDIEDDLEEKAGEQDGEISSEVGLV